jgi:drug/metabolite transporter (DMT)-like permease
MTSESAVILYALASGLAWGTGDFSGGMASRRTPVIVVIILSQCIGIVCLLGVIMLVSEPFPQWLDLFFGACGGAAVVVGLTAFYRGLASYPMGMVAPVAAAVSAMLPIMISFVLDGLPAMHQTLGLGLAIAAIWTISRGDTTVSMQLHQVGLPVIGGLGFAGFFICIDQVHEGVVFWPIAAARCTAILLLTSIILVARRLWQAPASRQLPIIMVTGVFDAAGNAFFALAANAGRLDMAVVLASLYPATTVLLAWLILQERLNRRQWGGVIAALVAVMLMAW